jgi:hypothetical protein
MASLTGASATTPTDSSLPPQAERMPSNDDSESAEVDSKKDKTSEKRRLFGLLKKKNSDKGKKDEGPSEAPSKLPDKETMTATGVPKPVPQAISPAQSPPLSARQHPGSPPSAMSAAVSPQRHIRSPSPGLHSPASSLIFERNVQEQPLPDDLSAAIPHHIQTEDHIPAVLEASSLAITDDHLNPDEVEIVMHSAHQPASMTVAGGHTDTPGALSPISSHEDVGIGGLHENDETLANYGTLDNADIRRLSFISFADVVQSEHVEANNKESGLHMSFHAANNRSPSPMRSPASSHGFGTSPPTSGAPSFKGVDMSNPSRFPGSPTSLGTHSPPLGGELMVETMRQTLRKTGSGDLSGARSPSHSQPLSAVSIDEAHADVPPFGK